MIDKFTNFIQARFTNKDDRGASAVEYGLLIAGIAALIVVAVFALGPIVRDAFEKTCDVIASNATPSSNCAS
jgi:pilus assembly protein Flp/PilA